VGQASLGVHEEETDLADSTLLPPGQCVYQPSVPIVLAVEGSTDPVLWRYRGVAKFVLRNVEFYEHRGREVC
jgi:hypothetical protein